MKTKATLLILALAMLAGLSSCNKTKYGNVVFWQQTGSGFDLTVVEVNGVTSNITSEYPTDPDCGASGCAVFNNLEVGTYTYTATDGVDIWQGSIEVVEGCTSFELY
ncbi:MAG: hypothetical protein ACK5HD_00575 [Bacteroidota bacterium]|jgi:hypothetical protein